MGISVSAQLYQLLASCLAGALTGVLYDILRVLRKRHRGLVMLADGLLCLGICVVLFYLAMSIGRGQFRLFYISGLLMGLVLWLTTVSPLFIALIQFIADAICQSTGFALTAVSFLPKNIKNFAKNAKKLFSF